MVINLLSVLRAATIAAAISGPAIMLLPAQALALTLTVGNIDYDIQTLSGSFNDNEAAITSSPWYGNATLAADLAAQSPDDRFYAISANETSVFITFPSEGSTESLTVGRHLVPVQGGFVSGTAAPSSVPEINAGALSQVMLMLLALWLVTRGRRENETLA